MHLRALKNKKFLFSAAGVCLTVTYIVVAWAARNEIFYLCGNFKEGVSYASVVRQMETSNLSVLATETSDFTPYISRPAHCTCTYLNAGLNSTPQVNGSFTLPMAGNFDENRVTTGFELEHFACQTAS